MLKNWLKKIIIISLELLLISGALWYVAEKKGIKSANEIIPAIQNAALETAQNIEEKTIEPFPAQVSPIKRTYNWEYKGIKYKLEETLYKSSYEYYKSQPKTFSYNGELPADWEEDYYGMFLKIAEGDSTIAQLANDLKMLGQKNKLTDDQIVELTLSFVQSIQYDDAKAKSILAKSDNVSMRSPYEVLFEQLGVCSDKSILTAALLRQMGYGTALFAYEQDNHMAIGIQCPKSSSTYGDGYCFAETTSVGNKIGILPSFDTESNKTVEVEQLASFDVQTNLKQLGDVKVYQQTTGKEYLGVANTQKTIAEIESLKKSISSSLLKLQSLKKIIASQENELESMKKDLEKYQKTQDEEKFTKLLKKYNDLIVVYGKNVKKYNNDAALYNQTVARYNTLIKQ